MQVIYTMIYITVLFCRPRQTAYDQKWAYWEKRKYYRDINFFANYSHTNSQKYFFSGTIKSFEFSLFIHYFRWIIISHKLKNVTKNLFLCNFQANMKLLFAFSSFHILISVGYDVSFTTSKHLKKRFLFCFLTRLESG